MLQSFYKKQKKILFQLLIAIVVEELKLDKSNCVHLHEAQNDNLIKLQMILILGEWLEQNCRFSLPEKSEKVYHFREF